MAHLEARSPKSGCEKMIYYTIPQDLVLDAFVRDDSFIWAWGRRAYSLNSPWRRKYWGILSIKDLNIHHDQKCTFVDKGIGFITANNRPTSSDDTSTYLPYLHSITSLEVGS